ncbi:MAG: hypothetical protein IKW51_08440 [Bacteroidales bacterium]|nr:hypothetical protein [Bacteroidales bacterium]
MRKYERAIIKHRCIERDGNSKAFSEEWKKYHDAKIKARVEQHQKDGKVTAVRTKPVQKKKHYDNGRVMLNHMRMMKKWIEDMKKQAAEKKSEKAD